jgi:dihydrofolate synthase/folylpolyglutamate synthase
MAVFLGKRPVTWFELVTLYAFLVFRQAKCDWAVYETGLGGRLDATNVVTPKASVITVIEREHTEYLGNTIEQIAGEKAGIIKESVPVFIARQTPSVRAVFEKAAREKNAPLVRIEDAVSKLTYSAHKTGTDVRIASPLFLRPVETRLRMYGAFQAENAALASVAVKTILPGTSEETIERGLSGVTLPARFEVIEHPARFSGIPVLVIDGAHTEKSVSHTVETFDALFGKAHLIFSCAADKDVEAIARLFTGFKCVTLTLPGGVKKTDPRRLKAAFFDAGIACRFDEDYARAITEALTNAGKAGEPVLVTGSFYLAGEVKKAL